MEEKLPRIPEFYAGRSILVTGFTGFMGKLLVEKLIWSCSEVDTIYVLLRGKRSLNFQQRFEKILNSHVFARCQENKKEIMKKIVPFEGDITLPLLGLTEEQRYQLINNVSIIFHCAASVKFDDPLPFAIDINVKGTKTVIDLALEMKRLVAFVQVSTAYSNCDNYVIEEKLYPPRADWRKTLEIREKVDEELLIILCEKYMNHMPNTYVFTKSLGEQIVNEYSDRLPMVIFRPSIVVSSWEEPFKGWLDNLNGPVGVCLGTSTGVLRTILVNTNIESDFMPADLAIRGLILTAYCRLYRREDGGLHLYNWCAQKRSVSYNKIIEFSRKTYSRYPPKYMIWRPCEYTTSSHFIFYINFLLFQLLPAFFLDMALRIIGREPMLWKVQRKVYVAMKALSPFTLNSFKFDNNLSESIEKIIPEKDFPNFKFLISIEDREVEEFLHCSARFLNSMIFKMEPGDFNKAKSLFKCMTVLDVIVKTAFFTWLALKIYTSHIIPTMFHLTIKFLLNF